MNPDRNTAPFADTPISPATHDSLGTASRGPMTSSRSRKRRRLAGALGASAAAIVCALALPASADARLAVRAPRTSVGVTTEGGRVSLAFLDSLRGRSRKLRARFLTPSRAASIPLLAQLFGDDAARRPGVYTAAEGDSAFHLITMRPFADKISGRIGSYRIGFFPSEQRSARSSAYANPEGFVEVTPSNSATAVSDHFRLADFLTHDQGATWPKYLVLREPLVDKLELVIDELQRMGVAVNKLHVMSGFRTPQYNAQGVGAGGRVQDSRHQYGDAADVYVVNGTRDWMGDLNRDGRIDTRDARVLADAANRVEAAHPELVGGVGVYPATSAHGPFVHIDVRGTRARWGAL